LTQPLFKSRNAGDDRVRLVESQGEDARAIRCAHSPNGDKGPEGETHGKEDTNPVLKMLKDEGLNGASTAMIKAAGARASPAMPSSPTTSRLAAFSTKPPT
jgi:hypothetical protein